ncbi:MAG: holo-ACP synthase [Candidatus Cloacimonetes bacterium]|nr:holo-ACP synthase [Candidatus Cloacimonadota bacterium]
MIFGIGIDNIEVERVQKQLEKNGFKEKIFSEKEIEYCSAKKTYAESFAARFAAKEAFFKAIGTGWRGGMSFKDIEIVNNDLGKPTICLHGKAKQFALENKLDKIYVSLTHLKSCAGAIVIIEKKDFTSIK